jgi:serine/threonine protein kinase
MKGPQPESNCPNPYTSDSDAHGQFVKMGNCGLSRESDTTLSELTRRLFQFQYPIGKGGFGQVWQVRHKRTKQDLALKEMLKTRIIAKNSVNSVINERKLLAVLKHPFIVNMQCAFQDRENLYLVMDLMTGGDLRYHFNVNKRFSEVETKFFAACVILGLEYLHLNRVIHRDIKPENLVLDGKGYVRITDLGIARVFRTANSDDTSGTPGYMAPEVICHQNHSYAADYFALGVIVYEFMLGSRPYLGKTRKEIRDAIVARQVSLKKANIPEGWSMDAADFINKLLQRKQTNRLGYNGSHEVKNHAWMRDVNWQKLFEKSLPAPFKPQVNEENFDWRSAREEFREEVVDTSQLDEPTFQALFSGYFFDGNGRSQSKFTNCKSTDTCSFKFSQC